MWLMIEWVERRLGYQWKHLEQGGDDVSSRDRAPKPTPNPKTRELLSHDSPHPPLASSFPCL